MKQRRIARRALLSAVPAGLWIAGTQAPGALANLDAGPSAQPVAKPLLFGGAVSPRAYVPLLSADGDFPPEPPPPPVEDPQARPSWDYATLNSIVREVATASPIAALTFDDGWSSRYEVLDALARHDVRATFFAIGRVLDANPDFVQRALDEGHEFGNHTYDHVDAPTAVRAGTLVEQLRRAEATFQAIAPGAILKPYFRPPGGGYNASVVAAAAAEGYRTILWSVDPSDWKVPLSPERVVPATRAGSIVLNHFNAATAANLGAVIEQLSQRKGIRFVTLTELFRS